MRNQISQQLHFDVCEPQRHYPLPRRVRSRAIAVIPNRPKVFLAPQGTSFAVALTPDQIVPFLRKREYKFVKQLNSGGCGITVLLYDDVI